MPDIFDKPKSKQSTTKRVHISWNRLKIPSFFSNDNFLTNAVSFRWNKSATYGFMQDELWDNACWPQNIANLRVHESTKDCADSLTTTNKAEQNRMHFWWDVLRLLKWLHNALLLFWCPFDASVLAKPFMILVNKACRPAIIAWATILEPYHLVKYLQVIWNFDIRGWIAMLVLWPHYITLTS